jgi:hypothetical protein
MEPYARRHRSDMKESGRDAPLAATHREAWMLKFSFSNEALEKALREDELLRHLAPNHWMAMTVPSPHGEQHLEPPGLSASPAPGTRHWSRCNKDW